VLDAALGELRAAGWPAPEDPDSGEDAEPDGRDSNAGRLSNEVSWLRQCAGWLAHLDADGYPPAVNLRPSAGWLDQAVAAAGLARVRAVIDRIAADADELARARRAGDPTPPRCSPAARGTPPAAGRVGPGVPGLLRPQGIARFIDPAAGAGSLSDEPARPGPGPGGPLPCADAATHGAGPAIARFNIAHYIIGSAAWVAALVMMALADVLTRLVMVYLRGRRLNAGPAVAPALIPASTRA
jgi:hypothetical protein